MKKTYWYIANECSGTEALGNMLDALGWIKSKNDKKANLIIIDQNCLGFTMNPVFLEFFHRRLGKNKKKVILVALFRDEKIPEMLIPEWLYIVKDVNIALNQLIYWLKKPLIQSIKNAPLDLNPSRCRHLLQKIIRFNTEHLSKIKLDQNALQLYLKSKNMSEFYLSILRIAGDYDTYHHDISKIIDSPWPHKNDAIAYALKSRQFRNACFDMAKSLCMSPVPLSTQAILLVDDNIKDYKSQLLQIKQYFIPYDIYIWNPIESLEIGKMEKICTYQSIKNINGVSLKIENIENGNEDSVRIDELSNKFHFILIDQLFKIDAMSQIKGPELIRGFTRILREQDKGVSKENFTEIIALSRTHSPERINEALRAGAKDYVLKSNLLLLPYILSGIQRTVSDLPGRLQRNFNQLYRLPNKTIGLLKTAKILPANKNTQSSKERENILPELLKAIPKTDLHIHVGSCMSTEFLVMASFIGLLQNKLWNKDYTFLISLYNKCINSKNSQTQLDIKIGQRSLKIKFQSGDNWITNLAISARACFISELKKVVSEPTENYRLLKSTLHEELGIDDYVNVATTIQKLQNKKNMSIALFVLRYCINIKKGDELDDDTLIRLYILFLAAWKNSKLLWKDRVTSEEIDIFEELRKKSAIEKKHWSSIRKIFYQNEADDQGKYFTISQFKKFNWNIPDIDLKDLKLNLILYKKDLQKFSFESSPIEWILATGTRSNSLEEYLEGCEFSGSLHLKHPFLMHLFAQLTLSELIDKGVLYSELRGSPDGYVNSDLGFEFPDVCQCFIQAFNYALTMLVETYSNESSSISDQIWLPDIFFTRSKDNTNWCFDEICIHFSEKNPLSRKFPVCVGLIFVGKRHKTVNQMILEAAASAIFHDRGASGGSLVAGELLHHFKLCRVVGFDLAGNEADFRPGLFTSEFKRISKLHIPITVHAGENASSNFIEEAILELGARRIGHALSLVNDKKLMERVREDRICVELCPTSNHQTCHFTSYDKPGRNYPLERFLNEGIPVCINTDNPIISKTDIINEYFEASASIKDNLSIWEALRIIKMGFRHAFIPLPQRKALLEIADQILYDLFSNSNIYSLLNESFLE